MKQCTSWGMFPRAECEQLSFSSLEELADHLKSRRAVIPRGNGRSYGDSALARHLIDVTPHNCFLDFNRTTGLLHVQAGAQLSEILEIFVPRGWFPAITPGTKLITVGGAIASDVHGKNHHVAGCFSECVRELRLMLPDGTILTCSREKNADLFHATCGGQGLTGVILDAKIQLKPVNSRHIRQTTYKTSNLEETFAAFEDCQESAYTVAWIDCLARNRSLGRCLLMAGDFMDDGDLDYTPRPRRTIPCNLPAWTLNRLTVSAFNQAYYHRIRSTVSVSTVDIDSFFYPLDAIDHWNRIYGRQGFTQYQFILPKESSLQGLREIMQTIARAGRGSFLAVLKLYGPANANWLSFPLEGYSLALDFKIDRKVFEFLDRLDEIVVQYGGRIYLTKDARVSKAVFEQGYPLIGRFRELRRDYRLRTALQSLQSQRLEL